jgi:hypothetical protein
VNAVSSHAEKKIHVSNDAEMMIEVSCNQNGNNNFHLRSLKCSLKKGVGLILMDNAKLQQGMLLKLIKEIGLVHQLNKHLDMSVLVPLLRFSSYPLVATWRTTQASVGLCKMIVASIIKRMSGELKTDPARWKWCRCSQYTECESLISTNPHPSGSTSSIRKGICPRYHIALPTHLYLPSQGTVALTSLINVTIAVHPSQ